MNLITKSSVVAIAFMVLPIASAIAENRCEDKQLVKAGTMNGKGGSVGFILGYRWAEGTITLNDGSTHEFSAKGGKIGEMGGAKVSFSGTIYNLKSLADFPGQYSGVATGLTLYKGLGGASFTNLKCVSINIQRDDSTGLQGSVPAPATISVKLTN